MDVQSRKELRSALTYVHELSGVSIFRRSSKKACERFGTRRRTFLDDLGGVSLCLSQRGRISLTGLRAYTGMYKAMSGSIRRAGSGCPPSSEPTGVDDALLASALCRCVRGSDPL